MIKLEIWEFDQYAHIGIGNTLLECIYNLSNGNIREGIIANISEYYPDNDFYDNEDFLEDVYNTFKEELSNSDIENRVYRWREYNNCKYKIIEED